MWFCKWNLTPSLASSWGNKWCLCRLALVLSQSGPVHLRLSLEPPYFLDSRRSRVLTSNPGVYSWVSSPGCLVSPTTSACMNVCQTPLSLSPVCTDTHTWPWKEPRSHAIVWVCLASNLSHHSLTKPCLQVTLPWFQPIQCILELSGFQ